MRTSLSFLAPLALRRRDSAVSKGLYSAVHPSRHRFALPQDKRIEIFSLNSFILLCLLVIFSNNLNALTHFEQYSFETEKQKELFAEMANDFRCVVCQNQTLADSYAPLAKDMKASLAEQILANKSKEEITQFFVSRYGEFILFSPVFSWHTALLWSFPILLFIGALWKLILILKENNR
jgi:cytochrome c-type biogenesis protein CcmH